MKIKAATCLLIAAFAGGCDNMKDQPSYRALEITPPSAHSTADFRPALHTVARGQPPPADPAVSGFVGAEPIARSPLPFTRQLLERGRDRFTIYCAVCHGDDGYGTGIVVRRGFPPPPSYHDDRLRQMPDGHLFDVMTRGHGVMLPYADRLTPHDRWAIVGYIRALQRSQHATLDDVPAAERARFAP